MITELYKNCLKVHCSKKGKSSHKAYEKRMPCCQRQQAFLCLAFSNGIASHQPQADDEQSRFRYNAPIGKEFGAFCFKQMSFFVYIVYSESKDKYYVG